MAFLREAAFTEQYQALESAHPALREVACQRVQLLSGLIAPLPGDLLCGRLSESLVGFTPEGRVCSDLGYYCHESNLRKAIESGNLSCADRKIAGELIEYWATRTTARQVRAAYSPELAERIPSDNWTEEPGIAFPLYRMAGAYLDYGKLLRLGVAGLADEICLRRTLANPATEDRVLYDSLLAALALFQDVCRAYAEICREQMRGAPNAKRVRALFEMADVVEKIAVFRPETFVEAIQLYWLWAIVAQVTNYGRMDMHLGPFLVRDRAAGRISEERALDLTISLWQLMADRKSRYNGRVVIGGRGRSDPDAADQFALLSMEATRRLIDEEPQLTLRWHASMDEMLMEKALDVIGEGRTYPLLYNDEINIPAVEAAFGVPREHAEQYVPLGCGEYVLDHMSVGTPSGIVNMLQALEVTLRDGKELKTFDALFSAYRRTIEEYIEALADQEAIEYRVAGEAAPFVFLSILYDDCIARGKGVFSGGARYLGGTLETYGNISTSDSLVAIKDLVYDKGKLTLEEVGDALDRDFEGCEEVRRLLKNAPKYGNNDPIADEMAVRVHEHVCRYTRDQAKRVGLDSYLVVIINNQANTTLGSLTGASADGRRAGETMTNANAPSGGSDRRGITALFHSLVKLDPTIHAGAVQNMKFGRALFHEHRDKLAALLRTYFKLGGTQAMITVIDRGELERAIEEPEKYAHLFVRVGGFSARFIDLSPAVQREIISRTIYE